MLRRRDDTRTTTSASPVKASSRSERMMQLLAIVLAAALLLAMIAEVAGVFGAEHIVLDLIVPITALPLLALTLLLYRQHAASAEDAYPSPSHALPQITHHSAPAPLSDPFAAA